ncbi:hypothetical protein F0365_05770 [Nonlabens sp. Ci31]|uniref:hypothetical protein n=1 Tax=Flavobacteriaceae TaxID=49546 RepID=UPI0012FCFC7A|nr:MULTISPECIES: hypothetical protein [Flavobacteriaceae]QJP33944.1 hypothetical protein F0365_05770 [Nonlabens sp. Ci31]
MKKTIFLSALVAIGMTFTNCSSDDDGNADTIAPTISIQSPDLNQTYSTDQGNFLGPEIAILTAQGVDNVKMETMTLTVLNSDGTVVFEETRSNNDPDNETILTISDGFETTNAGTYNVIFTATDGSGNTETSNPRTFTYED